MPWLRTFFTDKFISLAHREISALQSLRHENVIQFEGIVWENNDHVYLIFEYMTNDLRTYMDQFEPKGIRLTAMCSYLYQMAKGMEACHKQAILHRDLKTENVLIDRRGVIKVITLRIAINFH